MFQFFDNLQTLFQFFLWQKTKTDKLFVLLCKFLYHVCLFQLFQQLKEFWKKKTTSKDEIHDKQQLSSKIIVPRTIEQQNRSGGSLQSAKLVETLSLVAVVLLEVFLFWRNPQFVGWWGVWLILLSPNGRGSRWLVEPHI